MVLGGSPPPTTPKVTQERLRTKRVPFRRRTHDQHPFHEDAGLARTLSTSSSRPRWPQPLGLTRASRQDASSLNQQTTDASRHPLDFLESSKALRTRPSPGLSTKLVRIRAPSEWPAAVDTATFQPVLPHHSWWARRTRRAKPISCGLPLFDGSVVRLAPKGPCHGYPSPEAQTPTSRPGEAR